MNADILRLRAFTMWQAHETLAFNQNMAIDNFINKHPMTYQETKRENTRNAGHAAIKLLQHLSKAHGHHFHLAEQQAAEMLIDKATCNSDFDLLSEEYFNSIVNPIIYHK
jgi:hypothetical protein